MKRAVQFKLFTFLLLVPLLTMAVNLKAKDKHTKEKVIKKEFNVSANATLSVDNSYGNLEVITWNENRIVFEITITTSGNNEEKVRKKLDEITVDFEESTNSVSAKTRFTKNKSSFWWNWGSSGKVNMKINYIIKMPITNSVNLSNDYGNIKVGKLKGQAKIDCDYGKITTKELMADGNDLNFDYTNGCYFDYIKSGKINADYSSFVVGKTKELHINAHYTKSEVEIAETVTYNCDYGSLEVKTANTFSGNGDYLTLRLGNIYKTVSIKADYGSIKIDKLHESFSNLTINSDYSGIKIGYAPNLRFDFELDLDYAGLNGDNDFKFTEKTNQSHSKYYTGYYGSLNSGSKITIDSKYGGVTFYKN